MNNFPPKSHDDPLLEYQRFIDNPVQSSPNVTYRQAKFALFSQKQLLFHTFRHIENIHNNQNKDPQELHFSYILILDVLNTLYSTFHKEKWMLVQKSLWNLSTEKGFFLRYPKYVLPQGPKYIFVVPYILNLLRLSQERSYTVFFISNHTSIGGQFISNIKRSFPKLNIIGNYHYSKSNSRSLLESLRKTNPEIVILSLDSFHAELKWLKENKNISISSTIFCLHDSLKQFLETPKRVDSYLYNLHLLTLWKVLKNPFRWYRLFFYGFHYLESIIYRISLFFSQKDDIYSS